MPASPPPPPPRLARLLLESVLPGDARSEALLGDLHEEFVQRAARRPVQACVRYTADALDICLRHLLARRRAAHPVSRHHGSDVMDTLTRNLRYAARRLARSPFFTLVAVTSLALGIGANTAIFSLFNAVVLRDLPLEEPDRLVNLYYADLGFSHGTYSYPDFVDVRAATTDVFEAMGGMQLAITQSVAGSSVEMLTTEAVTGEYFGMLGVGAALGRLFTPDDDVAPGAHPVVILSHGYFQRRFGGDPDVLGADMRLAGRTFTVVGVVEPRFSGSLRGLSPDIYVPMSMFEVVQPGADIFDERGNHSFFPTARLRDGVELPAVEAALGRIRDDLAARHPEDWRSTADLVAVPTDDVIMNPMVDRVLLPAFVLVMGVVGLVLLIACANLASFLLTRAADRRKEIAVRLALGARRRTLVGQLLTETLLIAMVGGTAGVALAGWSVGLLLRADLPLPLPITVDASVDGRVLGFSFVVSVLAGILFGLLPALQGTRSELASTLRDETAGSGRGGATRLRDLMVVVQVAVSVVLLVGSGLFLRSLDASRRIDPGFGSAPAAVVEMMLPSALSDPERLALFDRVTDRIAAMPSVRSVGATTNIHLDPLNTSQARIRVDGVEPPAGEDFHTIDAARVDPGFFDAAALRIVAGRALEAADGDDPVVVVNEALARRFFDGNALGRSLDVNGLEVRIVGVAATARIRQLGEEPRPLVYRNLRAAAPTYVTVLARVEAGAAGATARSVLDEIRAVDADVLVYRSETMERHLAVMLLPRELGALVISGFAVLALLLAGIGLYGVVSYAVARRAREVGIRLSLGAGSGRVVRMLTLGGMKLVAVGGVAGLGLSALLGQLLGRLLYGVDALDPVTFTVVPLTLGLVALAAAWVPARRASRVDPVVALRAE